MTDISHEKQKCKFQTSHQTTRSKQRVYNAERRNHTEPKCSHLPRTHPAQVRRAHMSTSLHRVRSHLYKRAIISQGLFLQWRQVFGQRGALEKMLTDGDAFPPPPLIATSVSFVVSSSSCGRATPKGRESSVMRS